MILITRPKIDSLNMAQKLDELNINYLILPMIDIIYFDKVKDELTSATKEIKNVIVTSKNALRSVGNILDKNLCLNIVGNSTAELARTMGFCNINIIEENVELLITKLKIFYPIKTHFIYICGNIITANLKKILSSFFVIQNIICYYANKNNRVQLILPTLLKQKIIKSILFFSKKTALYLVEVIDKEILHNSIDNITVISISSNISNVLSKLKWHKILTAANPSEESMINLVKEHYNGTIDH